MKTHKSLLRVTLSDWRTWVVAAGSLLGWCQLAAGNWALASVSFCIATWVQLCKR